MSDNNNNNNNNNTTSTTTTAAPTDHKTTTDPFVQYLVVRRDLLKKPYSWSTGSLIANACHASVTALHTNKQDSDVEQYLNSGTGMYKVVLQAKDEEELDHAVDILKDANIKHSVWMEYPEGLRTCLATRPYQRSVLKPLLSALKLFR